MVSFICLIFGILTRLFSGFWLGYSQTSLILALNRCLSFSRYKWIFTEWRQYVWIGFPVALAVGIMLFGETGAYNSVYKVGSF
jgi:hypothetical protein